MHKETKLKFSLAKGRVENNYGIVRKVEKNSLAAPGVLAYPKMANNFHEVSFLIPAAHYDKGRYSENGRKKVMMKIAVH